MKLINYEIRTITLAGVNCYLIKVANGYIMIDTGLPKKRAEIEQELESSGCKPKGLRLIVLTHGDYDHAGNAAYLRDTYGGKIALHADETVKVERGDWSWGSKPRPDRFLFLFRVVSKFIKPGPFDVFKPDIVTGDGQCFSGYGFDATVIDLPGHTKGSIGVLTNRGDLFCGDLLDNMRKPRLEFFIDDLNAANASIERLKKLNVKTVYPGHGKPFLMSAFIK